MDSQTNDMNGPAEWVAALLSSKAALERGERVGMEPVLERMQAAIDRIEARQAGDPRHA